MLKNTAAGFSAAFLSAFFDPTSVAPEELELEREEEAGLESLAVGSLKFPGSTLFFFAEGACSTSDGRFDLGFMDSSPIFEDFVVPKAEELEDDLFGPSDIAPGFVGKMFVIPDCFKGSDVLFISSSAA